MTDALRDPIPPAWVARPPCLSGQDQTPRLRGWIHVGGLVLAVPTACLLIAHAAGTPAEDFVGLYAISLVVLYAVSASYHLLPMSTGARWWMRRVDHANIYVFIAACYTPYCGLAVGGDLGVVILTLVWVGAAAGTWVKLASFDRLRPVAGALYVVLGWLGLVTLPVATPRLPPLDLGLLAAMGLTYTAGAVVLVLRRPDPAPATFGYHEVWHSLVVVASACYVAVVWSLATGVH